ncbi:CBO0543 family protein [Tuberibacillus sp. Marseille-P3662]|uniref:CBO0543 family protein n=1 Tax=Tuberibacillus sp. Marseille-P3662 TaxID=1965358 RepID=UPI000A1CBAB4|nr:CBO0543 family protein [Tuberibacillus sp. Marseille-P3662]
MSDRKILKGLLVIGLISFPFTVKKPRTLEWMFIYVAQSILGSLLGNLAVANKLIAYPVRISRKYHTSLIYECLFYPMMGVIYNRWTRTSKGMFIKLLMLVVPTTILEMIFEKYTRLVKYIRWNGWATFLSVSLSLLFMRALGSIVRRWTKGQSQP